MVRQDNIGIRHRRHCQLITDHLRQSGEAEERGLILPAPPSRKLTVCVEGNISTGKSSFLKLLGEVDQSMEVRGLHFVSV